MKYTEINANTKANANTDVDTDISKILHELNINPLT